MLDNNNIQEQFTNEGWEKMRRLLDAELPVTDDHRKRPVFWMWTRTLGVAATVLLAALGTWWLASDTAPTPAGNIAISGEYRDAGTTPETGNKETLQTDKPIHQALVPEHPSAPPAPIEGLNARTSITKKGLYAQNLHKSAPSNSLLFNSGQPENPATLRSVIPTGQINALTPAEAVEADLSGSGQTPEQPALHLLPSLKFAGLPVEAPALGVAVIPVNKPAGAWRQGPELGGIVSFPTSLGGFHAGWAAEMPIAEGLALRGALRYDFQRQTVSSSDRQPVFENSMADFSNDPFNPPQLGASIVQPDTVISSTLKMHYAALPLSLSVKLNERWNVEGGIQVAYLFRAFREGRNGDESLVTNGNLYNHTNRSWYFSNEAQAVSPESFQPWDFALSAGLRYQLTRHWNVGLSGNFGLLNQANKANGYQIFNRNAVLSVGYYF